jgi:hypothetical protein
VCVPVCCRVARICVERYIGGEREGGWRVARCGGGRDEGAKRRREGGER